MPQVTSLIKLRLYIKHGLQEQLCSGCILKENYEPVCQPLRYNISTHIQKRFQACMKDRCQISGRNRISDTAVSAVFSTG